MRSMLAVVTVLALSVGVAGAATTVYTDQAAFLAAIGSDPYFVTDFDEYAYGEYTEATLDLGPENGFSAVLSANAGPPGTEGLWSGDGNMSTNSSGGIHLVDTLLSPNPVLYIGGDFFGSDIDGLYIPATVTISLSDGTVEIYEPALNEIYRGFASDVPILSLTVATDSAVSTWPAMDNLLIGGAGTGDGGGGGVPATSTWGVILLIALFMTVSLFYLRKRGSQNA